jgi:hypothetical protein
LGTASSAPAKASADHRGGATDRRLLATVKRLQRQNRRQGREIRALRAQGG